MTTQRRVPSGQGPSRRPGPSRVRNTGAVGQARTTGSVRTTGGSRPVPGKRATGTTGVKPGQRPGQTRRTVNVGRGATKRTVAPRPRALTGRATVLIVVFVALALAYTYPLRVYLAQKSQIAELEAAAAAQSRVIEQKSQELAKWQDPEYLRAKAREKLFYVRPGETPLLVFNDPDGAARDAGRKPAAVPDRWYDTLWSSVRAADAEPPN